MSENDHVPQNHPLDENVTGQTDLLDDVLASTKELQVSVTVLEMKPQKTRLVARKGR